LAQSSALQRVAIPLKHVHVVSYPLLDKGCEERSGKAEHEAHEPESVDPDIGRGWTEVGIRWRWSGRNGDLWGDRRDLGRDLSE